MADRISISQARARFDWGGLYYDDSPENLVADSGELFEPLPEHIRQYIRKPNQEYWVDESSGTPVQGAADSAYFAMIDSVIPELTDIIAAKEARENPPPA